jgi:hypothetical protein
MLLWRDKACPERTYTAYKFCCGESLTLFSPVFESLLYSKSLEFLILVFIPPYLAHHEPESV